MDTKSLQAKEKIMVVIEYEIYVFQILCCQTTNDIVLKLFLVWYLYVILFVKQFLMPPSFVINGEK